MPNTEEASEYRFRFPRPPWRLPLLCYLVPGALLGISIVLYVPREWLSISVWMGIGYVVFVAIAASDLPVRLFMGREVVLTEDHIRQGRRLVPWEDVLSVQPGHWLVGRGSQIRLRLRERRVGFFDIADVFRYMRKWLLLPGYELVYRDLLPALKRLRPEIPVSPVVERLAKDPGRAGSPRPWLVLGAFALNVWLMSFLLSSRPHGFILHVFVPMASIWAATLGALSLPLVRNPREAFLRSAICCVVVVPAASWIHLLFAGGHLLLMHMVAWTVIGASLLGAVVLLGTKRLSRAGQFGIAFVLLLIPAAVYVHAESHRWPTHDITSVVPDGWMLMPRWGESGVHLSDLIVEDMDGVLHVPSLSMRPVPKHEGSSRVAWLDDRILVRKTTDADDVRRLWVYDFRTRRELLVPTAGQLCIGYVRAVSPEGRRLVWLDCDEQTKRTALRVWNLETGRDEYPPCPLPENVEWCSTAPAWVDSEWIAVAGKERRGEADQAGPCHVLRIRLDSGETDDFTSEHSYDSWYPTSDFRYAFGVAEQSDGRSAFDCVDLRTDRATRLSSGGGPPLAVPSLGCAFRLVRYRGKNMLARLDLQTGEETPLFRVPAGMALAAVSDSGRLALLEPALQFGGGYYVVIHIPSARKHTIPMQQFSMFYVEYTLALSSMTSPFSPDETTLVLTTHSLVGSTTWLCTIPADWREGQ